LPENPSQNLSVKKTSNFQQADKAITLKGGDMASKMNPGFMAMMAKKKDGTHKMPDGKKMNMGGMSYAKGGGIESKGKTQGKNIAMKKGGKC